MPAHARRHTGRFWSVALVPSFPVARGTSMHELFAGSLHPNLFLCFGMSTPRIHDSFLHLGFSKQWSGIWSEIRMDICGQVGTAGQRCAQIIQTWPLFDSLLVYPYARQSLFPSIPRCLDFRLQSESLGGWGKPGNTCSCRMIWFSLAGSALVPLRNGHWQQLGGLTGVHVSKLD